MDDLIESQFFDAVEHIEQEVDLVSDCSCSSNWEYDVWISAPQSVRERRSKFIRWMGLDTNEFGLGSLDMYEKSKDDVDLHRIHEDSGAVLREEFSSSRSSVSSWSTNDMDLSECRNGNVGFNGESVCMVENERLVEDVSQFSPLVEDDENLPRTMKRLKNRWLNKLWSMTCMMTVSVKGDDLGSRSLSHVHQGTRIRRRVKVRHSQRRLKELSGLFTGQDIQAHEGSILTMKFSLDGQYLASAGEDKIVRVWQIVEEERCDVIGTVDTDPSCVYFSANHLSELEPITVEKDKINNSKRLRRTQDSACIIFPSKVFKILEKPLHMFKGHTADILDLSWSKNNCLLSSSVDKTVRLWQVGVDKCLRVFPHSDYVTCIQFNPVSDGYFISGSIDGKVRMWRIKGCKVVDWIETREIITAVSYRPDGQGGIIGSITGTCHFFDLSENHFQLGSQMCIMSKKKSSSCKRITGFQFLPQDPTKILVTCADSRVRIIDGMNVIGKYKGLRNGGSQISASFTSDGKHIISSSDDSNVYMWNYSDQENSSLSQPRVIRSYECFSSDASVAIPWSGFKSTKDALSNSIPSSTSLASFSLSQEYFYESSSKGSATWPEEKLPVSSHQSMASPISKSQYKVFKSCCQSSVKSHAWGMVIITAGWDGRIRSFQNYGLPMPL